MNVTIVGAGYVGVTLGVVLAERGCNVNFVDINEKTISSLNSRVPLFYEAGLQERLGAAFGRAGIIAFGSIEEAVSASKGMEDIGSRYFIVTLGTPINNQKTASLVPIQEVFRQITPFFKPTDLVILRSTVAVGSTRRLSTENPIISNISFCPERTVEGAALQELTRLPQIIAGVNDFSTTQAEKLFEILGVECIVLSKPEAGEMVKLASNSFRDVTFAFANVLAEIAHLENVNVLEVIRAANFRYERNRIPSPGLVGGPCLEKDPYILAQSLKDSKARDLLLDCRSVNEELITLALGHIREIFKNTTGPLKILLCGLAFKGKPLTSDTRGSLVHKLLEELQRDFPNVPVFFGLDPMVEEGDSFEIIFSETRQLSSYRFDLIIQMTDHEIFEDDEYINYVLESDSHFLSFWPVDTKLVGRRYLLLGGVQ
jgi:nucleotide sugar dehydrogenase